MKKIIISGGRTYQFSWNDYNWLDSLMKKFGPFDELVSGGALGADACGEQWARMRSIKVHRFPPDWKTYGRRAGPLRNREMAEYVGPDGICILFPGGKGTESMHAEALRAGLMVLVSSRDAQ